MPWKCSFSTKSVSEQAIEFVIERGYEPKVAKGVVAALTAPGSGVPPSAVLTMVTTMAGRWEVAEDNGLEARSKASHTVYGLMWSHGRCFAGTGTVGHERARSNRGAAGCATVLCVLMLTLSRASSSSM